MPTLPDGVYKNQFALLFAGISSGSPGRNTMITIGSTIKFRIFESTWLEAYTMHLSYVGWRTINYLTLGAILMSAIDHFLWERNNNNNNIQTWVEINFCFVSGKSSRTSRAVHKESKLQQNAVFIYWSLKVYAHWYVLITSSPFAELWLDDDDICDGNIQYISVLFTTAAGP